MDLNEYNNKLKDDDFPLRDVLFNDNYLSLIMKQLAINYIPYNLEMDYWLNKTENDVLKESIEKWLNKNYKISRLHYYEKELENLGNNKFLKKYPEVYSIHKFLLSEMVFIKREIQKILN